MDRFANKRVGIFGGTFDPIHYGHLRSALEVQAIFELQQVRLIPCANPPHRELPMTPANLRADMVELAIASSPQLLCDRRELQRTGASYTLETLQSLRHELGETTLLLFIGNDAFAHLTRWYRWRELFAYAHIIVLTRPETESITDFGDESDFFANRRASSINELSKTQAGLLWFQAVTPLAISATAIRQLIASGNRPQFLLPDAVLDYIKQHRLYQT
ncbi:MAG: nicotinate-nucleotide adenylyltransferase [Methylococcaceae bacterium]